VADPAHGSAGAVRARGVARQAPLRHAVCYSGDLGSADDALAPIRSLGDPVVDLLQEMPYTQVQSFLDETEPKGPHHYWKTEFVAELSDDLLSTARAAFAECPFPGGEIGFLHIGGALNELAEDDGSVGNRTPATPGA
jgi:hypothetical protein